MIKINFKQKIAILLSTLVTTSAVSASNSKNLNRLNRKGISFSTESGNKDSFSSKRNKLIQKSYDEKRVGLGAFGLVCIAGLLKVLGIFDKSKTDGEASAKGASKDESKTAEPTVVLEHSSLGINEGNIGDLVAKIETKDKQLDLLSISIGFGGAKKITDEDSFYILKGYKNEIGANCDLIVRFLNKDRKDYEQRREFYAKNLEKFRALPIIPTIHGIYKNAVVMETCNHSSCMRQIGSCGMKKIPHDLPEDRLLFDNREKVYYYYDHHNQESDDVKLYLNNLSN